MDDWLSCRPCWDARYEEAPGELPAHEGPALTGELRVRPRDLPKQPTAADRRAVLELVKTFRRALGRPVCTPEWAVEGRRLVRSEYRIWRWDCPLCRVGERDPDGIYRPLVIDSDGRIGCNACNGSVDAVATEVGVAFDRQLILENLGLAG